MTSLDHVWRLLRLDFSRVEFRSPLSVDECEARLRDRTIWNLSAERGVEQSPVVGDVSREDFFFYPRPNSRNLFQVCLAGRMSPAGNGTRLDGQFTIFLLGKVSLFLWFAGGGWFWGRLFHDAAVSILFGSGRFEDGASAWLGIAALPAGLLLGLAAVRLGRLGAGDEKRLLTTFLAQTIGAKQILEGTPPP